jgi:HD-like signal output (HDOD) protein
MPGTPRMNDCLDFTADPAVTRPPADADLPPALRRLAVRLKSLDLNQMPRVSPLAAKLAALDLDRLGDARAFCRMVEQEPVVAARLIGLSNSVAYGIPGRKCESIAQSVARIGLEPAARIAFGMLCGKAVNRNLAPNWREFLWLRAVAVTQGATLIAGMVCPERKAGAQLAGLIYDIGLMTLEGLQPGTLDTLVETATARGTTLGAVEHTLLGRARDAVATTLLKLWSVPDEIAGAVTDRDPGLMEPNSLAAILCLADACARSQAVLGMVYGDETPPFPLEVIASEQISARALALCPGVATQPEALAEQIGRLVARQRATARELAAA